jgi:hypothetical protein
MMMIMMMVVKINDDSKNNNAHECKGRDFGCISVMGQQKGQGTSE